MRDTWGRSRPFHGAGAVDRIWQGQNMFGPSDGFCSRYVGWLYCPAPGTYLFATSSDDASFLVLDDKLVASWPGWHGPVADARHSGSVDLPSGIHRLEYLHVTRGGTTCAVAAWQPPGAKAFEVIPANYFAPLSRAVVGALEIDGARYAPDFDSEITGEALLSTHEEIYAVKMAFTNRTAGLSTTSAVAWDFGDGQTGRGPVASHVYLADGIYPVTMTLGVGGQTMPVTIRVEVHQHWGWQTQKEIDSINAFLPDIERYDVNRLPAAACLNLMRFAGDKGGPDMLKRAGLAVVSRADRIAASDVAEALAMLREGLAPEKEAADDGLLSAFAKAFQAASAEAKAPIALALSDLLLERGRAGEALTFVKAALAAKADGAEARRLFVAAGDAARYLDDAAGARAAYAAAAGVPLERSTVQETALSGALALKAVDYIRQKEYSAAEESLDQWDWEAPLEKMEGYSSFVRGTLYGAAGRQDRALAEFRALAAVSPESGYAPKALLEVSQIESARRNREAARAALERIVSRYPMSEEVAEARNRLKTF